MLSASQSSPRQWTKQNLTLISETAERTLDAIERARAALALRDSERLFRRMADSMPQLVWLANSEGRIVFCSARVSEYAGIELKPDGTWLWQPIVHEDDAARTQAAWRRAVESGGSYQFEHRLHMRDGSARWHLSRALPVKQNGEIRWFGTATDIHELKQAEAALQSANAQLQESNRLKDEFMAVVSHELRTPLTSIALHAELLEKRPQAAKRIAPAILGNVQTQMHIVDDLLDSARIVGGDFALALEDVELSTLVDEVAQLYQVRAQAAGLELVTQLEPVTLKADPVRLRQALWGLLDNALKFTPQGGRITLTVRQRPTAAEIVVADTGCGVDPKFLPLMFNRFRQEEQSANREHGGLGLGLHLVKGIVEAHKGSVYADSAGRNRGLKVVIELPL